jgi:hypothetical protein
MEGIGMAGNGMHGTGKDRTSFPRDESPACSRDFTGLTVDFRGGEASVRYETATHRVIFSGPVYPREVDLANTLIALVKGDAKHGPQHRNSGYVSEPI